MKYLLDTNVCIRFLNGNETITKKFAELGSTSLAMTNTVLGELYYGAFNSGKVEGNIKKIEAFSQELAIFSDSQASAKIFGQVKAKLKVIGKPTQEFDLLIASIALANDCVLVTDNVRHFENIPDIRMEKWLGK